MKNQNKEKGKWGEEMAGLYLEKLGYEILVRNFSTRFGEIDLICKDNLEIIFVEVKSKTGTTYGTPEEMFTRYKYEKVRRMAQIYLKGVETACRIDMVAVEMINGEVQIRHYKNVVMGR